MTGGKHVDEDEIRRAVARGMRDYERSRPQPKGIIAETESAVGGCVAMFLIALVILSVVAACNR
ncbi:hypothetical protein GCM10010256_30660 [Streptomyces coeruleorubidus]|uniref:Uncharacterized protein n=1 Tax=Streptomyces coeruleorubidus TaxID=116188 RepID=A0A5J6IA42_STRC4|nr:hypothetical protein CP976_28405 [Streptomyces coeruleorubidus]GGT70082.1 hypothetical protein GCM10010256_30660 [Streptomyces coeruleorubidus]